MARSNKHKRWGHNPPCSRHMYGYHGNSSPLRFTHFPSFPPSTPTPPFPPQSFPFLLLHSQTLPLALVYPIISSKQNKTKKLSLRVHLRFTFLSGSGVLFLLHSGTSTLLFHNIILLTSPTLSNPWSFNPPHSRHSPFFFTPSHAHRQEHQQRPHLLRRPQRGL